MPMGLGNACFNFQQIINVDDEFVELKILVSCIWTTLLFSLLHLNDIYGSWSVLMRLGEKGSS